MEKKGDVELAKIIAEIDGSRWPWHSAHADPIDRPQRPIVDTRPLARRCATTVARSSFSQ